MVEFVHTCLEQAENDSALSLADSFVRAWELADKMPIVLCLEQTDKNYSALHLADCFVGPGSLRKDAQSALPRADGTERR